MEIQQDEHAIRKALRENVQAIRELGADPYPAAAVEDTTPIASLLQAGEAIAETESEESWRVAGRLMAIRGMGKAVFGQIEDASGRIQFYIRKDRVPEDEFAIFRKVRVGDFASFTGPLFRTRTGELTLLASGFQVLSKAIRPMPEKWHGLRDVELRARKRYLDLMVNGDVREAFEKRSRMITAIRNRLGDFGFLEVETPILQPIYGGAAARPFITHHNTLDMQLYLRIAPELYLKRLLVGGFEKVFEIGRVFRNEGLSTQHNPEFTMLELYQAYADFGTMMDLTEEIIDHARRAITEETVIPFGDLQVDYSLPFRRVTMQDAVAEACSLSSEEVQSEEALARKVKEHHLEIPKISSAGILLNLLFEEVVQPDLLNPTFVHDYPVEVSPLAKAHRCPERAGMTERFELFVAGRELANAFSELNDPEDQRRRFEGQLAKGNDDGENIREMDEDYLEAMEQGMPPAGGLGIGIDRMVMMLTGITSIREIILFPLHRPTTS